MLQLGLFVVVNIKTSVRDLEHMPPEREAKAENVLSI